MCLRHASVYAPRTYTAVRADRCPLEADDVGHGDVEAGEDEGGVRYPEAWEDVFVPGYEGPSPEQVAST